MALVSRVPRTHAERIAHLAILIAHGHTGVTSPELENAGFFAIRQAQRLIEKAGIRMPEKKAPVTVEEQAEKAGA